MTPPDWIRYVMWWQIYPLGFCGAPIQPVGDAERALTHRLERVEHWLDHLVDLGLNGLQLGPVFASETHGYDTVDHFRIDPRLGDDADFDRLVDAAHRRGIRVLLDGVFNHVGRTHPAFQRAAAGGPSSADARLFRIDWTGWQAGARVAAATFEGHDPLVALDHTSRVVEDLVVEVMLHWLDRGADGWRLDAAYAVPPGFWAGVLPRVRKQHPDAWFTGEVIHGDYASIVRESTMGSVTQYELWQGIWHSIADRNFFELKHAIERHDALLATFPPSTFIGNHDVTRIASAIGVEFVPHALAVLMTIAGVPSIYAGDEYAAAGIKERRFGGDDAVRPEFPDAPPRQLSDEAATALSAHRELIGLRRRHPWLHRAHTDVVAVTNETIVLRTATGEAAIVVALNLGDNDARTPAAGATHVLAGDGQLDGADVGLPGHGWAVLGG
jgi:cyclomaltodextrinase / maltogenic alpha-amylase / neopullulanase